MAWLDPNSTHNPSTGATIPASWGDMVNGNLDFLKTLSESAAVLQDQKAQNTGGGTFTQGAWRTRDLNTEVADPQSIVSISSNQFTPIAGSYLILAMAPCEGGTTQAQARLYNATQTSQTLPGSTTSSGVSTAVSFVVGSFTANGTDAYEIQHQINNTSTFGTAANLTTEVYTSVILIRLDD